jgi:cytochrome c-type biogenesis protein CcmH/NrfF
MSRIHIHFAVSCFLILNSLAAFALPGNAADVDDQRARIERLQDSVLAPCCYTEPVSRHQSDIALKMRIEIVKWVAAGRTDREILDTYAQEYGSKVLVDPRTIPGWWTPWIPWLTVVVAMGFGFWLLRRWHARPVSDPAASSDPAFALLPDFDDEEYGRYK